MSFPTSRFSAQQLEDIMNVRVCLEPLVDLWRRPTDTPGRDRLCAGGSIQNRDKDAYQTLSFGYINGSSGDARSVHCLLIDLGLYE